MFESEREIDSSLNVNRARARDTSNSTSNNNDNQQQQQADYQSNIAFSLVKIPRATTNDTNSYRARLNPLNVAQSVVRYTISISLSGYLE